MVAPRLAHPEFFDLTKRLGLNLVEIRNDLDGVALADGAPASVVGAAAAERGLTILSINALQRFNIWNEARASEAAALIEQAKEAGARALVLCPVNDAAYAPGPDERRAALIQALEGLQPLLEAADVVGLVEPLGFAECSLRFKQEAVEAIEAIGGAGRFKLVHDTFHHYVAGETRIFPEHTGLVHISGVTDPAQTAATMRDPHRVLVDAGDRIDNIGQIRALIAGGYGGPLSFEPFAASVHASPTIESDLRASLAFLRARL
jgi:2-keto-myo-inositol isomerase